MSETKLTTLVELKKGETEFNLNYDGENDVLRLTFGYDGKGVDSGVYVDLDRDYFLDKLADAIPGELDDKVFELLKAAF